MGLFENGQLTPGGQGLLALSQALLQAGQPSRVPVNLGSAFAQGLNAFTPAYQQGVDQQNMMAASNAKTPQEMMAALSKVKDPAIQAMILKSRMEGMNTKYEMTKDAFGNPIAVNPLNPSDVKQIGGGANPFGATGGQAPQVNTDLKGEDFLKTLPPQIGSQVKALAEGRMQFPGGFALKSPYWQQMLQAVSQYDPNFDTVNYNSRGKTLADTTSGKTSQNIKSIETAFNTLAQAKDASDDLGGASNWGPLNGVVNWAENKYDSASNNPKLNIYNTLAKTAADEVTRAVVGAGGTGADRQTREGQFHAAQSPEARNASLTTAGNELLARLEPVADNYNKSMGYKEGDKGYKRPIDFLSENAQKNLEKLLGKEAVGSMSGEKPPTVNLTPQQIGNATMKARSAIAKGASRDAVIKRLQDAGIDTSKLDF